MAWKGLCQQDGFWIWMLIPESGKGKFDFGFEGVWRWMDAMLFAEIYGDR